jgi:predicted Rossmann-fold nucleotide-binding protein
VVAPGGIGTVLETLMVWQLLQVRHLHDTPLILVGTMWSELVRWAHAHMLDPRLALVNLEDLSWLTAGAAVASPRSCCQRA